MTQAADDFDAVAQTATDRLPSAAHGHGKLALACRPMVEDDIGAAILLLSAGFPERDPSYWRFSLQRLRDRPLPAGLPRYGTVLTANNRLVGIVLTIFSTADTGERRVNLSSWYVEPDYRGYSSLLVAALVKMRHVTLFNISPAPTTLDTIAAQGFVRYAAGTFQALAALAPRVPRARVRKIDVTASDVATPGAPDVLRDHAQWGCLCYEVDCEGETYSFVFAPTRFLGGRLAGVQLAYCRDIETFVRFAGPLGRHLAKDGFWAVLIDADGPIDGLVGLYRGGRGVRYFSGALRPRLGDLSYTELTMFGA